MSSDGFTPKYRTEIQQMMFVSGETGEAAVETTTLIEEIVRNQVHHMLKESTDLANRRGNRAIATTDLMYLIRHDRAKLSRLRHFLQWKDVRKNVKDSSDDKGAGDAGVDLAGGDEALGAGLGAGPDATVDMKKNKKNRVELPWDVASYFSEQVPPRDDEEDEEEEEMNFATLQRLKLADERTKNMSKEDYMHWSECRQASFTFRKGKRFREWAGFGVITDSKPNDDIIDILGFLTFEIVQTLTEEALKVKVEEDMAKKQSGIGKEQPGHKRKREPGLFDLPEEEREPVSKAHVQEAFRRTQQLSLRSKALGLRMHIIKQPLKLVSLRQDRATLLHVLT
ncbi:transcription initiation protein SPT3 [Rhizodiscina lignyota]|uniref:Transcription initiation protein SPT3 n=1 Tax=Rhizodiscina lignyota TaxID=1504668 RepID=A0A9P4ILG5_9PEZI|nr:transcription initiation protein SPT3 [Rhizodiscina lignyota]